MKKIIRLFVQTVIVFSVFGIFFSFAGLGKAYAAESKSYVIAFDEGTSADIMQAIVKSNGLEATKVFDDLGIVIIKTSDEQAVQQLTQNPQVAGADIEGTVSIPKFDISSDQSPPETNIAPLVFTDPIYNAYQWHIRRVRADWAWGNGYTGSHNTVVGIVDVGVASNHPDLANNIVYEKCFTSLQPTCEPYPQFQGASHGTIVAGIIGALANGQGVIGVAPNVGIANYNVSETGPNGIPTVLDSSIWQAIDDAAEKKLDVLNFSFGEVLRKPLTPEDYRRVANWQRVINKANAKGVTIVASAGNNGVDLNDPDTVSIPCELPNVYCAGATNIRPRPIFPQAGFFDEAAFYTNYGDKAVDIAAPGGDCGGPNFATCLINPDPRYFVWTTTVNPNSVCAVTKSCPVSYTASIGTSFSAPHTAGTAALIIDLYRTKTGKKLKPEQVRDILSKTADPLPGFPQLGAGMINAQSAIQKVLEMVDVFDRFRLSP